MNYSDAVDLEVARASAAAARPLFMRGGGQGVPAGEAGMVMTALPGLETWDRQLILTAVIALEVGDVRAAYDAVQTIADGEGALITSASLQAGSRHVKEGEEDKGYGRAAVVLRMPQSRFHAVHRRLLDLAPGLDGRILKDEVSSQDVTEEYVDLKSRLRHWQSQETQLLEIMRRAQKIPDILSVRNQLSEVQQEIERITGRLRFLENRVDLSTITVEIVQKDSEGAQPTIASNWKSAGKAIAVAWTKSLRDVVYVLGLIGIGFTYVFPFAVLAVVVYVVVRTARRKARAAAGAR